MRVTPIRGSKRDKPHKDRGATHKTTHCRDVSNSLPGTPQAAGPGAGVWKFPIKVENHVPGEEGRLQHCQPGRARRAVS